MADLTPELLDQIEKLAKVATPGPWRVEIGSFEGAGTVLTSSPPTRSWTESVLAVSHVFYERHTEDWRYIASASPDNVLALVADSRKLATVRTLLDDRTLPARFIVDQLREVLDGGT